MVCLIETPQVTAFHCISLKHHCRSVDSIARRFCWATALRFRAVPPALNIPAETASTIQILGREAGLESIAFKVRVYELLSNGHYLLFRKGGNELRDLLSRHFQSGQNAPTSDPSKPPHPNTHATLSLLVVSPFGYERSAFFKGQSIELAEFRVTSPRLVCCPDDSTSGRARTASGAL